MADQTARHLTQTRGELAARDTAVAEPCRRTREQASEIALSRQELDRAAQGQSTTGAAARAEIETLRDDLATARQTAGAAMQRTGATAGDGEFGAVASCEAPGTAL
jgi:hypothetical protein